MSRPKLSVVIPCFNEEKRLQKGFEHYFDYLSKQKYHWELILVDDGSRDKTLQIMENIAKVDRRIKFISYKVNKGKGYAIVQGIKSAKGAYILFSDVDHSVAIKTIKNFFAYFEQGFKVVIASRRVHGSTIAVHQQPLREFLGRGFTFLVNILIAWGIKDATCGFKAFENKIAQKIFKKITIYDWAFDAEILFLCKKFNINFAQAPVKWSDARGSKVRLKKDILVSLLGLFKIRLNDIRGKYN